MKIVLNILCVMALIALTLFILSEPALAQASTLAPALDSGSTSWMLVSTLLVLMMTLPGLALFYGGMVHKESVLATLMQSFVTTTLVTVLWVIFGYSMIFTEHNSFIGGLGKLMLSGIEVNTLNGVIPETVFCMFQMTFGIITCALIFGSVATRIKFSAALIFVAAWFTLVYVPIAHWVWGPGGMLGGVGLTDYKGLLGFGTTLDFAGGTVVHINAGIAGLMAALVLGHRKGFATSELAPPYNIVFSVIGASLLWVGWFGFNAGSAAAANGSAGMAMLVTQVATATASLTWMFIEWIYHKKPSVIGIISGAVAGLVAITPASGFVDLAGAMMIGIAAGGICYWACGLKFRFGFDDSLDVFGVHCVGGIVGALLTGVFAVEAVGGKAGSLAQFLAQCEGVGITILYCGIVSYIILKVLDIVMGGVRVDEATEHTGLDLAIHGNMLH
jgi:ammonium transporter, Amt family